MRGTVTAEHKRWRGRYLRIGFFSFVSPTKKSKTWQAIARPVRAFAVKQSTSGRSIAGAKVALNTDGQNDCCACYRNLREPVSHVQARRRLTPRRDCDDWGFRGSLARIVIRQFPRRIGAFG